MLLSGHTTLIGLRRVDAIKYSSNRRERVSYISFNDNLKDRTLTP